MDLPWHEESKPTCLRCGKTVLIADDVAAATPDTTWSAGDSDLVAEVISGNREFHIHDNDKAANETEKKVPAKNQKTKSVLNKVFGHDQNAIEGFNDCENEMQKSLNEEKYERDADTEFEGTVKTKRKGDAQKSSDDDEKRPKERPPLDGQDAT